MWIARSVILTIILAIALIALIVYPFVAQQAYLTYTLMLILLYSVLGLYYNLLMGYTGIPFLGPLVPYAIAGYTTGFLVLNRYDPFLAIAVGTIMAGLSSFAFSLLSMRLKGLYMALYSFVFVLFFQQLILRQDIPLLFKFFLGGIGQSGIPDITLGGFEWRLGSGLAYYYLAILIFVVSALILKRILDSPFGAAFRGIRDAETYASTLGVGVFRTKILAFFISSLFMGLVGSVLTLFYGAIGANVLDTSNMLVFLTTLVFGGLGTFFGPLIGALVLVPLNNYLTSYGALRILVWGLAILVVVIVAPVGIVGKIEQLVRKRG
jgi:branched-chain amino acid transport system permease protein